MLIFQAEIRAMLQDLPKKIKSLPWRNIIIVALPFLTYLLLFKFYVNIREITGLEEVSQPNIDVLPALEEHLFFCHPHKLLSQYPHLFFDCLAAVPYLLHFPLPFLFMFYLLLSPKKRAAVFPYFWCAGWVNLIAVLFQLLFPTAPPWYTDTAVFDQNGELIYVEENEAGFQRLDHVIGHGLFHGIYSQSPVKFGAFPSLHIAWPTVILLNHPWFGWKVASIHVAWITLAALYSTHHYAIDALGGILLAVLIKACIVYIWSPFEEYKHTEDDDKTAPITNSNSSEIV